MRGQRRSAGAMRVLDWAFPAPSVHREVLHVEPSEPSERPPLLFVHGLAHAAWCWEQSWLGECAARGWSAYALSLRAHGGSGGRDRRRRVRLAEYEHDVLQQIVRLPRPPVMIAHSMGCLVAARVAARYPFAGLVLLAPVAVDHGGDLMVRSARRAPGLVARMSVGLPARLSADDLFHGLDASTTERYLARLDPEPPLAQLQLLLRRPARPPVGSPPVLVYGAENDALVPAGGVERTARFYGVAARWLPRVGHDVMLDEGNEQALAIVLDDLSAALAGLGVRGRSA